VICIIRAANSDYFLLVFILTFTSPLCGFAANTYTNKLQTFKNKVLRIITELPKVTPIIILYKQKGISVVIRIHIKKLRRALYQKSTGR
jgi:hypothetical protein